MTTSVMEASELSTQVGILTLILSISKVTVSV